MNLYYDLDGTIANLYGVNHWLDYIISHDPIPYEIAEPLCDMKKLKKLLTTAKGKGYNIIVISWLSKNSTADYDKKVIHAKKKWLTKYGLSDILDSVEIVPYGTPKHEVCAKYGKGILFDDEAKNRDTWDLGKAIDPTKNLLESLENLLTI